ncbi:hypothetical protein FH5T_08470 [Draconibacterium orientale]|uniref:Uncharacterized protein n=1 Tax=Draconibacterium orientale TaxID=1168034 RepID=A0ABM5QD81_9BACT|nr:hypothetical protein FH5T_08470 [Draconibacterium orientale]
MTVTPYAIVLLDSCLYPAAIQLVTLPDEPTPVFVPFSYPSKSSLQITIWPEADFENESEMINEKKTSKDTNLTLVNIWVTCTSAKLIA